MKRIFPEVPESSPHNWEAHGRGLSRGFTLKTYPGYSVARAPHPTALWPWYGVRPDGAMILAPSGRAFQLLEDCKAFTEQAARDAH